MSEMHPQDEYSAINAIIHDLGAQWSQNARAIKFDIEFKAIEDERRRVAKEIHDEVLPLLARLIRSIQGREDGESSSASSAELIDQLHLTVAAFRDQLAELHAVDLEEFGLICALGNMCKRYSRVTGRSIVFSENGEECTLNEHQQLCLYRAIQTVLRMFAASSNDILIVSASGVDNRTVVTMRCVDKRVSAADWLMENIDFNTFESWCAMAGAEIRFAAKATGKEQFPYEVIISAADSPAANDEALTRVGQISLVRIKELDSIIAAAQEEWAEILNRECELFRKLTVEVERKKIVESIEKLITPHMQEVSELARNSSDTQLRKDVKQRMRVIEEAMNSVIAELHPYLIDKVGLVSSLRTLVARFRHSTLIETTMISNLWSYSFEPLSIDTKFALYRATQEALNNIEKHSGATRTLVTVTKSANQLVVSIEDNGKGIQPAKYNTMSRGLRIIKERAAAVGANVQIQNSISFQTGTLLTISLSCPGLVIDSQMLYKGIASK